MPRACRKCSASLTTEQAVHLWDGHDYCHDCVEAACPGMVEYVRTNPLLIAIEPTSRRDGVRNLAFTIGLATTPFVVIFLFGYFATERETMALGGIVTAVGFPCGIALLLFLVMLAGVFDHAAAPRHSRVGEGKIVVSHRLSAEPASFDWDDSNIRFYDRGIVGSAISSPRDCPYIYVRRRRMVWSFSPSRSAFKLPPEMGRWWKGLLSLQPDRKR